MTIDVQAFSDTEFWLLWLFFVFLSVVFLSLIFYFLRCAKSVESMPNAKVQSAEGYVELLGKSQPIKNAQVFSPLRRILCTWYRYKVTRVNGNDEDTVAYGTSDALFSLCGNTGSCVIDPAGADVAVSKKEVWVSDDLPRAIKLSSNYPLADNAVVHYRLEEEVLLPGEQLCAIGMLKTFDFTQVWMSVGQEISALLQDWRKRKADLLSESNILEQQNLDLHKWMPENKEADKEANSTQNPNSPIVDILSKPVDIEQPFMLSSVSPKQFALNYRFKAAGNLLIFLAVLSFSLWLWGAKFGSLPIY